MGAKVLLVMQDEILAKAYRIVLSREGFEVEHARTGQDGLAKARRWVPEIMLLDLVLPGAHGLDVLKLLRDVPWLLPVHVVLLLEHTWAPEVLNECLIWGAGSYLRKDRCSLPELVAHLKTVLQTRKAPAVQSP